jgi:peptide/nickel transport system permease protein
MIAFIIRRLIAAVLTLFAVSLIVFFLVWAGGNPYAKINQIPNISATDKVRLAVETGLREYRPCNAGEVVAAPDNPAERQCVSDVPAYRQYLRLVFGFEKPGLGYLQGDLGDSFTANGTSVADEIKVRLPPSLKLLAAALIVSLILAVPLGVYSALRPYTISDYTATFFSFLGYAMPVFLLGLLLQLLALRLQKWNGGHLVFATGGRPPGGADIKETLQHYALPVTSLAVIQVAGWSRYQRASMLDVLSADYLRTARAKGLTERRVIVGHALRNAMLPLITILAIDIAALFSGAVVTETIFGWNGIGQLLTQRIGASFDPPVVLGIVMIGALMVVVFNAMADVAYAVADPRIRLS